MAARHEITCINKTPRDNPYDAITHVGGATGSDSGGAWRLRLDQAIAGIEQGKWEFFVRRSLLNDVKVVVAVSPFGNKYLKTEADGAEPNNLLSLPEC